MESDVKINALEAPYRPDRRVRCPTRWEPEQVGRALVRAFATLDRLPRSRGPREPGGHWPRIPSNGPINWLRPKSKKASA